VIALIDKLPTASAVDLEAKEGPLAPRERRAENYTIRRFV
jgi:hypothetical protein